jgi:hypothetical protein
MNTIMDICCYPVRLIHLIPNLKNSFDTCRRQKQRSNCPSFIVNSVCARPVLCLFQNVVSNQLAALDVRTAVS